MSLAVTRKKNTATPLPVQIDANDHDIDDDKLVVKNGRRYHSDKVKKRLVDNTALTAIEVSLHFSSSHMTMDGTEVFFVEKYSFSRYKQLIDENLKEFVKYIAADVEFDIGSLKKVENI